MGVKNTGYDLTSVKSPNTAAFNKIAEGKLDEVKILAKAPEFCHSLNEEGQTPLHYAIEKQKHEIALYLLKLGHEVNTSDRSQWTPLISASKFGNVEVVRELLKRGAKQKSKDDDICEMGEWSAITWAAYRGNGKILEALLENPATRGDPNFNGLDAGASYGVTPLLWAAGRGHVEAVDVLLRDGNGVDVNKTDKFGCNALFWACRKGEDAVVKRLLKAGIDINAIGAHGQSALIVATRNMHEEVVEMLLSANLNGSDPVNVSHVDSDNNTALNFAADKGLTATVRMLLEAGASKNHQNKKKQTPLILAVKKGHLEIVRLLLNHDVNVNLLDKENRSALYLAVKESTMGGKNPHKEIIKLLVKRKDIYLEAFTKINDNKKIISETALLKAVRNRNASIVNILLKSGASVDVRDQDWNNPLHLSIRFRDKTITEMLLRNPKNSNLVYKKNKENETPHEIDLDNPSSILTKIWGEKIVTSSTKGLADDMSQYELYTNSLADILAEPGLKLPITVGIFAKWGSGKDFLLLTLAKVMGSFVGDEGDVHYNPPLSVHVTFLIILGWICTLIAGIAYPGTSISLPIVIPCIGGAILLLYGTIIALATHGNRKYIENDRKKKWRFCNSLAKALTRFGIRLKLVSSMLFKTGVPNPDSSKTKPVKFLFANQARLNIGASENSLAEVIGALSKTAEEAYGFLPVRIYRAMKPRKESVETRSFCCLPLQSIFLLFWLDIFALTCCLAFGKQNFPTPAHFQTAAIITGVFGGVLLAILTAHYWQIIKHMIESPYSRVLKEANKIKEGEKSGREQLKREVDYLAAMVKAFDQYGSHQTRMVIVVNGLDSYKQDDVLKILELVNSLFTQSPYIVIFAVDDNLIRKAVDKDRKDTWEISGRDYLQNMIHLPFYMHQQSNDLTLRRRKILPSDSDSHFDMVSLRPYDDRQSIAGSNKSIFGPQESRDSLFSPQEDQGLIRRRGREGRRNTLFENGEKVTDSTRKSRFEKSKNNDAEMLLDEDWLSSISPQIMKRILNSKSLTGRLLRANFIPVSSDRLSRWIKMTELAPYRTSWIIWYIEENEDLDLHLPLKSVYQKIVSSIPSSTQEDKVLAIDSVDSRDMEVLLSARDSKDALTVKDVVMFLPNTVNLDPNLREWIDDVFHTRQLKLQSPQQLPQPSPSNLLLQPLTRVSETTESSSETPQISAQGPISLSSVPAASQVSVCSDMNCEEVANWVISIENMTAGGKARLEKYILEQNITGNFLMKMRNKLQIIKSDTQLNLGDFFLLEDAITNIRLPGARDTSVPATSSTGFTPRSERHEPLGETTAEKGENGMKGIPIMTLTPPEDSTSAEHLPISEYRQALAEYWRITALEDENCDVLKI